MTHNASCGCTDVIAGIGRTIFLVRLYVIESDIRMVDMPQISLPLPSSLGERVSFDFLYPLQEIMNELKYYNCMNFRF